MAATHQSFADHYRKLRNFPEAEHHYGEALAIWENRQQRANLAGDLHQRALAVRQAEKAEPPPLEQAEFLSSLAMLYRDRGGEVDLAAAGQLFEGALEILARLFEHWPSHPDIDEVKEEYAILQGMQRAAETGPGS